MPSLSRAILVVASLAFAPIAAAQPVLPGSGPAPAPPPPSPGAAPGGAITKLTPQQLAQLYSGLTINGQPVPISIKTFNDGTSVVVLPLWGPQLYSGVSLQVCEKDGSGCHWLEFFANVGKQASVDANWINAFNQHFLGAKAYTLASGELVFEEDISLWPGISPSEIGWYTSFFKHVVDDSFSFKPQ
jgi:hypothetical protein